MELTNIIRVSLVAICLLSTLTFILLAISKQSKRPRNLRMAGLSFITLFLVDISIFKLQNVLYPPTNKIGQLTFLAFGVSSNNEKGWLGLYEDSTWEFGKSHREINSHGSYHMKGDTVFLTSGMKTEGPFEKAIMIVNDTQVSSANPELNGLRIERNNLDQKMKHEL